MGLPANSDVDFDLIKQSMEMFLNNFRECAKVEAAKQTKDRLVDIKILKKNPWSTRMYLLAATSPFNLNRNCR